MFILRLLFLIDLPIFSSLLAAVLVLWYEVSLCHLTS